LAILILLNAILFVLINIEGLFFATSISSQPETKPLNTLGKRQLTVKTPQTPNGINPA
jgi:hypothetical protein